MILGIGIDLVDIFRISKILEKYPGQFAKRVLGKREFGTYEKILFSTESATETLIFLKTTSISRKLNIKLNPSKLKLIKYFL